MSNDGSHLLEAILDWDRENLDSYIDSRKKGINGLVHAINRHVSIPRYMIGGSIGKGTSLGPTYKPDFDVNLFIDEPRYNSNGALQTFLQDQLQEISTYLTNNCGHFCKVLYTGPVAVGVYLFREKSNVDLIPTINFGKEQQYDAILDRIVRAGANLSWANVCYAEESVRFLNTKEEFTLNVARLAKHWNKHRVKMGPMSGRSVIVETVALKAAQDELDRYGDNSTLRDALIRFFKYMEQPIQSVRILPRYDRISDWPDDVYLQMMSWGRGPSGYVVDPVNPYRNFLDDPKVHENWHRFQNAAKESVQYINSGDIELSVGFNPQ